MNAHNLHLLFWLALIGAATFIINYKIAGKMKL
jgi:hypothetical protein